jgi:hypothetical protein
MVVMATLLKKRIRFSRLLVYFDVENFVGGVKDTGKSSSRCSYGVANLVLSTCVAGLVLIRIFGLI